MDSLHDSNLWMIQNSNATTNGTPNQSVPSNIPLNPKSQNLAGINNPPIQQLSGSRTMNESANHFAPMNIPFHPNFAFNPMNVSHIPLLNSHYGSNVLNQKYGSVMSFQDLLNSPKPPEELNPMCNKKKGTKRKVKDNQTFAPSDNSASIIHWSKEEELALTASWLHVSVDADVGAGQRRNSMWSGILQVFKENMGNKFNITRNTNSLQCHWKKILRAVNKYHAIYERLQRHPQSGSNPEDMRREAMRAYTSTNKGEEFRFEHCWEIMRKNPKWCTDMLTKANEGSEPPNMEDNVEIDGNEKSLDPSASKGVNDSEVSRPQGRKACKERKRNSTNDKNVSDALVSLQSTLEKQISIAKEELELKRDKDKKDFQLREKLLTEQLKVKLRNQKMKEKAQKRQHQRCFLETDVTKLSPEARAAVENYQVQIIKEWAQDVLLGGNIDLQVPENSVSSKDYLETHGGQSPIQSEEVGDSLKEQAHNGSG